MRYMQRKPKALARGRRKERKDARVATATSEQTV